MTALLELRENLKKIYSRNEAFILPVIKFLLSFIVLSIINGKMGYMTKIDNMAIVLIVSLLCSFLPTGFMVVFAMLFTEKENLLELYNAISRKHYTDPELLEVNTLENAIYMSMRNDISFVVDGRLSLYEH